MLASTPIPFSAEVSSTNTVFIFRGAVRERGESIAEIATSHGTEQDLHGFADLITILESKVGRRAFNRFPTGVEVCHAIVARWTPSFDLGWPLDVDRQLCDLPVQAPALLPGISRQRPARRIEGCQLLGNLARGQLRSGSRMSIVSPSF